MNKIKTIRSVLSAVTVATAWGLVACGGGGDSNDVGNVLPKGTVGTSGDGINQSEYEAVSCGMSREQVQAIIGDSPTTVVSENLWSYTYPTYYGQMAFGGSGLAFKMIGKNNKAVQVNQC